MRDQMGRKIFSFKYVATVLLTIAVLILGGLNVQQQRRYIPPDDGASWVQVSEGVQARIVVPGGPAEKAGIQPGDLLKTINGQAIENERQVTQILYKSFAWHTATYTIVRNEKEISTIVILEAPEGIRHQRDLEVIGLIYFLVGTFVLLKRSRAPNALHFYFVCLTSFVLYVFHFTGKHNTFDWTIFWFDLGASLLLPPLFLHFCLEFPLRNSWFKQRHRLLYLIYIPGAVLFLAQLAFIKGVIGFAPSPIVLRDILNNLGDFYFGLYFVFSAIVLIQSY